LTVADQEKPQFRNTAVVCIELINDITIPPGNKCGEEAKNR